MKFAEGIHVYDHPLQFGPWKLGCRMTVIVLSNGDLWVHSPNPLTSEMKTELDGLGKVKHIVTPNAFHDLYAKKYLEAYPEAHHYIASSLSQKRKDLCFEGRHTLLPTENENESHEGVTADWQKEISAMFVPGVRVIDETVFLHKASRTLVLTDMLFNFQNRTGLDRAFCKCLVGVDEPRASMALRAITKDKPARNKAFKTLVESEEWSFDKIVLSHGDNITENAKGHFQKAWKLA